MANCRPLIFANSLDSDQNVLPDLDPNWLKLGISERFYWDFFLKVYEQVIGQIVKCTVDSEETQQYI